MELVRRLVAGEDQDDPLGTLVYQMGSAFTHGQQQLWHMLTLTEVGAPAAGMRTARVGITAQQVGSAIGPVVYGVHRTMLRACAHYGWNLNRWEPVALPALEVMRRHLP